MKTVKEKLHDLIKEHGLDAVKLALVENIDSDHDCKPGYIWDEELGQCILDIGGR